MLEWSSRFTPLVKIQKAREELLIAARTESWIVRSERIHRADHWLTLLQQDLQKQAS